MIVWQTLSATSKARQLTYVCKWAVGCYWVSFQKTSSFSGSIHQILWRWLHCVPSTVRRDSCWVAVEIGVLLVFFITHAMAFNMSLCAFFDADLSVIHYSIATIFLVDILPGTFISWTREYDHLQERSLQDVQQISMSGTKLDSPLSIQLRRNSYALQTWACPGGLLSLV